jgi:hypothetical protein
MENEIENLNSLNEEEVQPQNEPAEVGLPADPVEVEPIEDTTADTEALKARNQELYEQLKKAKGFIRDKEGKWIKKENPTIAKVVEEPVGLAGITTEELYSLVKANVPDEDTREVKLYARSHGISITDALKLPEVKAILKVKQEYRKTEEATNTGFSRRGNIKVSDDTLISSANKGDYPTSDEEITRLAEARLSERRAKKN